MARKQGQHLKQIGVHLNKTEKHNKSNRFRAALMALLMAIQCVFGYCIAINSEDSSEDSSLTYTLTSGLNENLTKVTVALDMSSSTFVLSIDCTIAEDEEGEKWGKYANAMSTWYSENNESADLSELFDFSNSSNTVSSAETALNSIKNNCVGKTIKDASSSNGITIPSEAIISQTVYIAKSSTILEYTDANNSGTKTTGDAMSLILNGGSTDSIDITVKLSDGTLAVGSCIIESETISDVEYYKLTLSVNNEYLAAFPTEFGVNMSALLDGSGIADDAEYELKANDSGNLVFTATNPYVEPLETNYTLTKAIESKAIEYKDSYSITYKITANVNNASNGETLNGYIITDAGPTAESSVTSYEGDIFELAEVYLVGDTDTGNTKLTEDTNYTVSEAGVFSYTISDKNATTVTLQLKYTLTAGYIAAVLENAAGNTDETLGVSVTDIKNTAYLYEPEGYDADSEENTPLTTSETDWSNTTSISKDILTKSGKQNDSNSTLIDWTITIDTKDIAADNVYLLDYLSEGNQEYNGNLYIDDESKYTFNEDTSYTEVTFSNLTSTTAITNLFSDKTDILIPLKQTTKGNDDSETVTYGYALNLGAINYSNDSVDSSSMSSGETITITYSTKLTDASSYTDAVANSSEIEAKNTAHVFGNNFYYGDEKTPVITEGFDFGVGASEDITYEIFNKSGSAKGNTINWTFTVNKYGAEIDTVVIEDKFLTSDFKIDTTESLDVTTTAIDGSTVGDDAITSLSHRDGYVTLTQSTDENNGTTYSYSVTGSTSNAGSNEGSSTLATGWYTVEKEEDNVNYTYVCIVLTGMNAEYYYTVTLPTEYCNIDYQAAEGSKKVTNTADAYAFGTETAYLGKQTDGVDVSLTNNIIDKTVSSEYNYSDHTIGYTITVNPNGNTYYGDGTLTENLPVGTTLTKVTIEKDDTAVTVYDSEDKDATDSNYTLDRTTSTNSDGYSKDSFTLTIKDSDGSDETNNEKSWTDTYDVTVTVEVDEDYRNSIGDTGSWTTLNNEASFKAEVRDNGGNSNTAEAIETKGTNIQFSHITKSGYISDSENGIVTWTAQFNTGAVSMKDIYIVDELPDSLELELGSINIYKGNYSYAYSSTLTYGDNVTKDFEDYIWENTDGSESFNGFVIKIPKDYAYTPLYITFDTNIVSDSSDGTNNIYITYDLEDGEKTKTSNSGTVNVSSFSLSSYITSSSKPRLTVTAYDEYNNCISDEKLTLTYTKDDKDYTKVRTTSSSGTAYFLNLSTDIVYTLTQDVDGKEYTIKFTGSGWTITTKNDNVDSGDDYKAVLNLYKTASGEGGGDDEEVTADDIKLIKTYENVELSEMDTDERTTLLSATKFTLYANDDEKTVVAEAKSLAWDADNERAIVTFTASDDGIEAGNTYILKETSAAEGFILSTTEVYCKIDDKGSVEYSTDGETYSSDFPELINCKIDDISLIKTYENTDLSEMGDEERDALLSATKFTLYANDDEKTVVAEAKSLAWDAENERAIVTFTAADGIEAGNTYILKETSAAEGFILSTTEVYCKIDDEGSVAYSTDGETYSSDFPELINCKIDDISLIKTYEDETFDGMTDEEIEEFLSETEFTLSAQSEDSNFVSVTRSPVWDGEDAVVTFTAADGIEAGNTYLLQETKAHDDYEVSAEVFICYVDSNGSVTYLAEGSEDDPSEEFPTCENKLKETGTTDTTTTTATTTAPEETTATTATTTAPEETTATTEAPVSSDDGGICLTITAYDEDGNVIPGETITLTYEINGETYTMTGITSSDGTANFYNLSTGIKYTVIQGVDGKEYTVEFLESEDGGYIILINGEETPLASLSLYRSAGSDMNLSTGLTISAIPLLITSGIALLTSVRPEKGRKKRKK